LFQLLRWCGEFRACLSVKCVLLVSFSYSSRRITVVSQRVVVTAMNPVLSGTTIPGETTDIRRDQ
jgi:hypothetical protein